MKNRNLLYGASIIAIIFSIVALVLKTSHLKGQVLSGAPLYKLDQYSIGLLRWASAYWFLVLLAILVCVLFFRVLFMLYRSLMTDRSL